jgi:cobalamin synthase
VVGIAAAAGVAAAWRPLAGVAAVTAGVIAFAAVVALGWRRIGGFTGDVLGAAGVVGESLGLVVACAKW